MLITGTTKNNYKLGDIIPYGTKTYKVTLLYQLTDEQMIKYQLYGRNRVQLTNIDNITDIMDFTISE